MHAGKKFSLKEVLLWTRRDIYKFIVLSTIPTLLFVLMDWKWFLFSFKGRINRKPFWIFNIVVAIFGIIISLIFGIDIITEDFDAKS